MASNKTQLMAQFYEQCQNKGYTDMHDDRQSLKAKVIATDLGLRYGNIIEFYEKAAQSYQQIQAEKAEEAEKLRIQRQEEQAERARRAVNGRLLVTVSGGKETLKVFLRPDNTFYCTVNDGGRIEGIPSVTVHKGGSLQYTYHPSETVFTGASAGGIMMGGTHQTEAHYTERVAKSGKGYIQVSIGSTEFSVTWITMSDYTQERFKRDAQFKELVSNGRIRCNKDSELANSFARSALMGGGDIYTQMSQLTMAADEKRLPYETCRQIAKLLGRVIHGDFPPTDEEIYEYALNLSESKSSKELLHSIEAFLQIIDYRDTTCQLDRVQEKYEEVLQTEKEQAILEKEAAKKKTAKILKITVFAVCVIAAFVILLNTTILPTMREKAKLKKLEEQYSAALALMEAGEYEKAVAAFKALGDYNGSSEKVQEAMTEFTYQAAIAALKNKDYDSACEKFSEVKDYKDSAEQIKESKYQKAVSLLNIRNDERFAESHQNAYDLFSEISEYKDSTNYLKEFETYCVTMTKYTPASLYEDAMQGVTNLYYDESGNITSYKTCYEDGREFTYQKRNTTQYGDWITEEWDVHYYNRDKNTNEHYPIITACYLYSFSPVKSDSPRTSIRASNDTKPFVENKGENLIISYVDGNKTTKYSFYPNGSYNKEIIGGIYAKDITQTKFELNDQGSVLIKTIISSIAYRNGDKSTITEKYSYHYDMNGSYDSFEYTKESSSKMSKGTKKDYMFTLKYDQENRLISRNMDSFGNETYEYRMVYCPSVK